MPAPIKVGNVTVHQVVEQEGPFFDILPFFPTLTRPRYVFWPWPAEIALDRIVLFVFLPR